MKQAKKLMKKLSLKKRTIMNLDVFPIHNLDEVRGGGSDGKTEKPPAICNSNPPKVKVIETQGFEEELGY